MSATMLTNRPLAISESFTQGMRDRFNDREPIGAVRALVYADVAGTLYLEESDDVGENYTATATVSVAAATTTELAWTALTKRWYRYRYANSTTAQTKFVLIQQARGMDSLPAGAGLIGKVGIDQVTAGANHVEVSGSITQEIETITVSTAVRTFDAALIVGCKKAVCTLENGPIRVWTDGTAPTSALGQIFYDGDVIILTSAEDMANFKAIKSNLTGATDGILSCVYQS